MPGDGGTERYSMMARHYEPLFPILEELDVGLVAFSPMANGFLTGQYDKGQRFDAATDYRAAMPQFTDKAVDQNAALFETARRYGCGKRSNLGPNLHGLDVV